MLKNAVFSCIFNIKMVTQKVTSFDIYIYLMHGDMNTVTIQSNKIALNKVKEN